MKQRQGAFRYLAVLLPCLLAVGCGSLVSSSSAAPIKIGLILPLTSGVGGAAQSAREGAELAIEEANGNNGVRGRRLALVTLDDGGAPDVAARHVDQLAGEQVVAIVGPLTDAATIGAAGAAERHQVVIISPGATAPIPFGGSFVFRTAPPVRTLGGAMAGFLVDTLHLRRIAIVHDSNEYGTMAARAFEHAVTARLAAVSSRRLYRDGEADFTRHVRGALVEQVQAVFVAGYPDEAAVLLQQLRAVAPGLVVAGSDALHSDDLLARAGAAANGLYVPTGFAADARLPIVRAFVTKYQQKHNRPPDQFAAQAYDAVRVIAQAMRVSGVDRQKVRQAVATLKRYPGVTGTLTFDRWGDPGGEVIISRVNGGVFVSVNP